MSQIDKKLNKERERLNAKNILFIIDFFCLNGLNLKGGFPKFYPLPMMGGIFWATGNLMTVPIIKSIGIGLGPLLWNTVLLVFGWAVARFGLLGIKEVNFKGLDI